MKEKTKQRVIIGDSEIAAETAMFMATPAGAKNPLVLDYHPEGLWVEVRIFSDATGWLDHGC